MTDTKTITRRELENAVTKKALTDTGFRQALTADPRRALQEALTEMQPGATLPPGLKVQTLEEPQDTFFLVIPHVKPSAELSDMELEAVAGGVRVAIDIGISISA